MSAESSGSRNARALRALPGTRSDAELADPSRSSAPLPSANGVARSAGRRRAPRRRLLRSARLNGLLFTLPVVLVLALVVALPLIQALYYSFTNWDGSDAKWVGLQNYATFFADADFQRILVNSVLILLSVPVGMILPFVTAYLLSSGLPGGKLFRAVIFAPTALSWVVIGLVSRQFFSNGGAINSLLGAVGLGSLQSNWLAGSTGSLVAVLVTFNAAVFGVNTIIFLTGLSALDRSMIEAARVDGASGARILVSIVMPPMRRFVEFVFVITVVLSFTGLFGLIYVMTGGGPGSSTTTLEFAVWKIAFASGNFGLAAALGVCLMLLTLGVIGAVRLFSRNGKQES